MSFFVWWCEIRDFFRKEEWESLTNSLLSHDWFYLLFNYLQFTIWPLRFTIWLFTIYYLAFTIYYLVFYDLLFGYLLFTIYLFLMRKANLFLFRLNVFSEPLLFFEFENVKK